MFTRITATIGLAGGIIGATLGGLQLYQKARETRETRAKVGMYLAIGERFEEASDYKKAIEQYEKAREHDDKNTQVRRRIVVAMRKKLWVETGFPMLLVTVTLQEFSKSDIDEAIATLYQAQAIDSSLKQDRELLLEEAYIYRAGLVYQTGDHAWYKEFYPRAIRVLERAWKLYPNDSDILAELGFVRAMRSSEDQAAGLDLLQRAIEIHPDKALYHYYLAKVFQEIKQDDRALREFYQAAQLVTDQAEAV